MNNNPGFWWTGLTAALLLAPLLNGVINKTKAVVAGRHGPSLLQPYYNLAKLLRKGCVRTSTSCGLLAWAPIGSLAAVMTALLFLPFANQNSPFAFTGDVFLFAYLLGLGRFALVLGAMDTGSSFEGMGASREVQFAALAEGAFFAVIGFLAIASHSLDLSGMLTCPLPANVPTVVAAVLLAAGIAAVILLVENCRVPFDDPETHLELTMIHEAMILDFSGPDLAFILYGASLKLWLMTSLAVLMLLPGDLAAPATMFALHVLGTLLGGVAIGLVESATARFRFLKLPQFLLGALGAALVALAVTVIGTGRNMP
ncbi:MAG: NADH-quinone oxidoreductase subunit H [Lentisphaeria bacterium]|nr:NADH-quinone oxidoreductase subunit H [Lentisphaeria bacterium]